MSALAEPTPARVGCVSVIIPVLNCANTIAEALASVLAQPEVGEVIVVDDGSTDGSADIVRGLNDTRIRLETGPARGVAQAYNVGYAAARLDYVAVCDGDDVFADDRLSWQVSFLENAPDYIAVAGAFSTTDPKMRIQVPLLEDESERDVENELMDGKPVSTLCAWLMRRDAAETLGGRRTWFALACDLDFQFRAGAHGRVRFVPRLAYVYRLHTASITHANKLERVRFFGQAARDFARQRQETGVDDLMRGSAPEYRASERVGHEELDPAAQFSGQLMGHAHALEQNGRTREAARAAYWAVRMQPQSLDAWRSMISMGLHAIWRWSGGAGDPR